jgi:hypothetical protein
MLRELQIDGMVSSIQFDRHKAFNATNMVQFGFILSHE